TSSSFCPIEVRSAFVSPESFSKTMTVGMSFWLWKGASLSSAFVDSALAGSQDEAWLSCTSASLLAPLPAAITTISQKASTSHLVTRPVSFPAICRCMSSSGPDVPKPRHRGLPRVRRPLSDRDRVVVGATRSAQRRGNRARLLSVQLELGAGLRAAERRRLDLACGGCGGLLAQRRHGDVGPAQP